MGNRRSRLGSFDLETIAEQAVLIARKALRRPATGRRALNAEAPRSDDGKPEQRFSGLRSSFQIE
jgi:hypothetical protein